jgi:hypothetical protein
MEPKFGSFFLHYHATSFVFSFSSKQTEEELQMSTKKRKYGNPLKEKTYREAVRKANASKKLNPTFTLQSVGKSNSDMPGIINIEWSKDEQVHIYSNTSELYHAEHRDSLGAYSFLIRRIDSEHVAVTVETTPYNEHRMTKEHAYWEWDMLWKVHGRPIVLMDDEDGAIKIGSEGASHTGHRGKDLHPRKKYEKRSEGEIVYYESSRGYYVKENGKLRYLGTKLKSA